MENTDERIIVHERNFLYWSRKVYFSQLGMTKMGFFLVALLWPFLSAVWNTSTPALLPATVYNKVSDEVNQPDILSIATVTGGVACVHI